MDERHSVVGNIRHKANPLHIYCRLMDIGMDKHYATRLCSIYEMDMYKPLDRFLLKPLHKIEMHISNDVF